jgi:hypothetical protein
MRVSAASRAPARHGKRREPWTQQYRRFAHRDGHSYAWDGTSTYVDADDLVVGLTSAASFSMWVKCGTSTPQRMLVAFNDVNGTNRMLLFWPSSTTHLRLYNATGYTAGTQHNNTNIQDSAWHHVVLTAAGVNALIYVDGVKEFTGTNAFAIEASSLMSIGAEYDVAVPPTIGDWYHGSMSQFAVYDRVLTQAEVTKAYNGGAAYDERRMGAKHVYWCGDRDAGSVPTWIDRGRGRVDLAGENFVAGDITADAPG